MNEPWNIALLGGLRLTRGQARISHFRTHKTGALMAYLAYHRTPQPREQLVDLLWPESGLKAGRQNLRTALAALRHQLEAGSAPGTVLHAAGDTIALDAAVTTDVEQFLAALDAARGAPDNATQAQLLESALELYRGPLLPGYYEDWIPPAGRRLEELFFQAMRRLVEIETQNGDCDRAVLLAQRGLSEDPLREELHCALMRLYINQGQPGAALRQYQELSRLLNDKLGLAPGPEARELVAPLGGDNGDRIAAARAEWPRDETFRVLVVEDEEQIARLILRSLRQAGLECYHAADGQAALEVLPQAQPHLILLDIAMPRMDGLTACEEIRKSSDIPIIIATAQRESEAQLRAFALGADDYILKPFRPKLLVARVQANLRRVYQYHPVAVTAKIAMKRR